MAVDFSDKNPSSILTKDELKHFDEGMEIKGQSSYDGDVDFGKAVRSVSSDLDRLFS